MVQQMAMKACFKKQYPNVNVIYQVKYPENLTIIPKFYKNGIGYLFDTDIERNEKNELVQKNDQSSVVQKNGQGSVVQKNGQNNSQKNGQNMPLKGGKSKRRKRSKKSKTYRSTRRP